MESCIGNLLVEVVEKEGMIPLLKKLAIHDFPISPIKEVESLMNFLIENGFIKIEENRYSLTELGFSLTVMLEDLLEWIA